MEDGRGLIPGGRDAGAGAAVWPVHRLKKAAVDVLPLSRQIYLVIPKIPITPEVGALAPSRGRRFIPCCILAEASCGRGKAG